MFRLTHHPDDLFADDGFGMLIRVPVESLSAKNMFVYDTWYRRNPILGIKYRDNYRLC